MGTGTGLARRPAELLLPAASPGVKSSASTVPNAGLFIQRETKHLHFQTQVYYLHGHQKNALAGDSGLQFQLSDTLIHGWTLHQVSLSPCGYTVLLPAWDQQWEDALGAASEEKSNPGLRQP